MHKLLRHYITDVEYPNVSGAEHVEMLQIRDKLFELEPTLSANEKKALHAADQQLIARASEFYAELNRFIDFAQRRQAQQISVKRWWWHLDVLAHLPQLPSAEQKKAVPV